MCPCDPNDNTLNPVILPPIVVPGFGVAVGPYDLFPDLNFKVPLDLPEDLLALVQKYFAIFPAYTFRVDIDDTLKTPLQGIMQILSKLTPFLALYKFFLALLNMVVCIIDVLCGLITGSIKKLKKLFKQCLPEFLSLFPWLALVLMIISLILLLIAIIDYIIAKVLLFINDIVKNLKRLTDATRDQDPSSILAIAQKISNILCILQGLFAVLISFQAIWSIIEDLSKIGGRLPCDECCEDSDCPPFIKNNPSGISGELGNLLYYNSINQNFGGINLNVREENWQFYDNSPNRKYNINNIITPIEGNIFWPQNLKFTNENLIKDIPYVVDLDMFISNPSFWNPLDTLGARRFIFKNVYFIQRPYYGLFVNPTGVTFNNSPQGTAKLSGGLVYESDGITPYLINGKQASLDTFIHQSPESGPIPSYDDGYYFTDVKYTWKPQSQTLFNYLLITAGCIPEINNEITINSAIYSNLASIASKINFPNINNCFDCLMSSLDNFRKNVSEETAPIFQSEVDLCLNNLRDNCFETYKQSVNVGFDPFTSTASLDTNLQFINLPIQLKVTLKDPSGNPINLAIPSYKENGDVAKEIAKNIIADITLGEVSLFEYDGIDSFIANIISNIPGNGQVTVSFNNNNFKNVINRDNLTISTAIEDNVLSYTFVGGLTNSQSEPRRDVGDIARDVFNNIG